MHEMSVAESLVAQIAEEVRRHGFRRVREVRVRLGALGHVEPEALRFCFDAVSRGTVAEGARLALETVAGEGRCPACGSTVALAERYDLCPACGAAHVEMTAGDELRLAELEVE